MSNFNIGDSVEVLPAPEEGGFTWRMVGRRQGTVKGLDTRHPLSRTVEVLFRDGSVYFCDPAWLRRVPYPHEVDERRTNICPCGCGWSVGYPPAPRWIAPLSYYHDAPSRPQEARSAPCDACPQVVALLPGQRMFEVCPRCFQHLPSPSQNARTGPSEGKSDSRAIGEPTPVTGPRYKVGDFVDMGEFKRGEVLAIDAEPRYSVQWPDGCVQCIKESTLRPHVAAPAKCAPDGTRCEEWQNSGSRHRMEAQEFRFCPFCGGKLQNDRDDA